MKVERVRPQHSRASSGTNTNTTRASTQSSYSSSSTTTSGQPALQIIGRGAHQTPSPTSPSVKTSGIASKRYKSTSGEAANSGENQNYPPQSVKGVPSKGGAMFLNVPGQRNDGVAKKQKSNVWPAALEENAAAASSPTVDDATGGSPRSKMQLERVIGLTASHNNAVATNPATGDVAIPAGCILIIYQPRKNRQKYFFRTKVPIHCVAFSPDGEFVAVGGKGPVAPVEIWELKTNSRLCQLDHHHHGVACLSFSPSGRYLISVGFRHDHQVLVWEWKQKRVLGKASLERSQISSVAYSEDGKYFVTSGEKHLQFWPITSEPAGHIRDSFPETDMGPSVRLQNENGQPAELVGRPGIMPSVYHEEDFVDVVCGMGPSSDLTFALTESGYLCVFDHRRTLDQYVQIKADCAFGLSITPSVLAVACADSIVRVFRLPAKARRSEGQESLMDFIGSLPVPPAVGQQNVTSAKAAAVLARGSETDVPNKSLTSPVRPAAICVKLTLDCKRAVVVYGDRSLFIWDIQGLEQERVVKYRSFLHHGGPIWDVKYLPDSKNCNLAPADTFVTISSDSTVRFWNMNPQALPPAPANSDEEHQQDSKGMKYRNVFSRHLLHVLYVDKNKGASGPGLVLNPFNCSDDSRDKIFDLELSNDHHYGPNSWPAKAVITKSFDPENGFPKTALLDVGVKAIDICSYPQSSDLEHYTMDIAVGDRQGNLRVFDFARMEETHFIAAHDAELVSLQYSPATGRILISGSRDKLVHVFDVRNHYKHSQVLDFHDTAITCGRFSHDDAKLITCGSDASMVFSRVKIEGRSPIGVKLREELLHSTSDAKNGSTEHPPVEISKMTTTKTEHNTIYDLDVDATNRNVITVGQDQCVRVFAMRNGKSIRTYNAEGHSRDLNRVRMDPSGLYVACSGLDKIIRLYDFYSGTCLARMSAHAEVITGLAFSHDCKRMVSTAGDGCIMVWRLAPELTNAMQDRLNEISQARDRAMQKKVLEESRQLNIGNIGTKSDQYAAQPARPPIVPPSTSQEPVSCDSPQENDANTGSVSANAYRQSQAVPIEFRESVLPAWAKSEVNASNQPSTGGHAAGPKKFSKWEEHAKQDFELFSGQVPIQPPQLPGDRAIGYPSADNTAARKTSQTIHAEDSESDEEADVENKVQVQSSRGAFSPRELKPTKSSVADSPQLVRSKRVEQEETVNTRGENQGVRQSLSSTFMGTPQKRTASPTVNHEEDNEESLDISITEDEIATAVKASARPAVPPSHQASQAISKMHQQLQSLSIFPNSSAQTTSSVGSVANMETVPSVSTVASAQAATTSDTQSLDEALDAFQQSKEQLEKSIHSLTSAPPGDVSRSDTVSRCQSVLRAAVSDLSRDLNRLSEVGQQDVGDDTDRNSFTGDGSLRGPDGSLLESSERIESLLERYSERISTMVMSKIESQLERTK
eukprot:gb/GECG01016491.1/.p1 GENE.gb/GECG01016491.1/~~gb/GECG01016491.1/.p1  ORF type:complete len:1438 (+),score=178.07 gb/GECG01016491.1/:1-4314(+)